MNKIGDKALNKIVSILKNNSDGLTITEIVDKTNLSRSAVRTALANLDGGNKVSIKKIGMAKVYILTKGEKMNKKLFLFFTIIFIIFIINFASSLEELLNSSVLDNGNGGQGLHGLIFNTSSSCNPCNLTDVYKFANTPANDVVLRTSREGSDLATANFTGNLATFNYELSPNTGYWLLQVDTAQYYYDAFSPPVVGTLGNITCGVNWDGALCSALFQFQAITLISADIFSLISPLNNTFSNNPNQTFIINWAGLDNLTFFLWDATGAEVLTPSILNLTGDYSNSSTFYYNFSFPYVDDGTYYWNSLGNDTIWANNGNFTFILDTTLPSIDITYPINNTNSTDMGIDVNYTVSDTNLQSCWYSNDSYSVNTSLTDCGTNITEIIWDEGQHNVTIWANDSAGNENSSKISFMIDFSPNILIIFPTNNTNLSNNNLNVNYTASDNIGLGYCWYSNDSYSVNTTLDNCNNITEIIWTEGQHNVTIWVNDTLDNQNSSEVSFTIDTIAPTITLYSPSNQTYNYTTIDLNVSADELINTWWYSNNSGLNNNTFTPNQTYNWEQGSNTLFVWANDSVGNETSVNVTFFIDSIAPNLDIIFPTNNTNSSDINLDINYTVSDTNLQSCWYSNDSYSVNTSLTDCGTNITEIIWTEGQHNVTIWANDSVGNENSSSVRFTIDTINPNILISFPTNNTNSTDIEIDINYTVSDANLQSCWYSNDSYSINVTLANCSTNITTITWALGQHNVTIWANDSAGNENNSQVTFNISIISSPPVAVISGGGGGGCVLGYKIENGKCVKVENKTQSPSQLFDIKFELDSAIIKNSNELSSVIRFESFGNVPTPVDLTYKILDSSGTEVYSEKENVIVFTELIIMKDFENLELSEGKYTLILTTVYGDNVKDEFRQEFEIKDIGIFSSLVNMNMPTLIAVITTAVFVVCFLSYKIYKKRNEK